MIDRLFLWIVTVLMALVSLRDVLRYYMPFDNERRVLRTRGRRFAYIAICGTVDGLLWLFVAKMWGWV